MSEHEIVECPNCGTRDYVLKADNVWACLECRQVEKILKSKFTPASEEKLNLLSVLASALIVAMFMLVGLNAKLSLAPSRYVSQEPQLLY